MSRILIFGGTTEGRLLAEYCHDKEISVWVSVATGYGKMVLPESRYLHIQDSPMNTGEMEVFLRRESIDLVFDATHPYAAEVSQNIITACKRTGAKRVRVVRKECAAKEEHMVWTGSVEEAVLYLSKRPGNVLVTTGSKELSLFTALDFFEERVFARVLPSVPVISACEQMGLKGKHLIGMQGPFSVELNQAVIRQYDIRYLVTKEAGSAGGFPEKIRAAADCGITAVVVGRPVKEEGITLEEAKRILAERSGAEPETKRISLIGTGMGGPDQMTGKALNVLKACDVVFGAERMLLSISHLIPGTVKKPFYLSRDILPWLKEHKEYRRIGILYSGDTGFYSGAEKMAEALKQEPYCHKYLTEVIPGVSSVSYLCSRLKTGWEDVRLLSLHGRDLDIVEELKASPRVFVLLDGTNTVKSLCRLLKEQDFAEIRISVGERLSYPDERITIGTPEALEQQDFDALSAVLIER